MILPWTLGRAFRPCRQYARRAYGCQPKQEGKAAMGIRRANTISCALMAALAVLAFRAAAHEIPTDVRINAFLRPEGKTLELLLRAPLAAMHDIDVPRRGPGYLDLSRAEPALRHAAQIWLVDNVTCSRTTVGCPPLASPTSACRSRRTARSIAIARPALISTSRHSPRASSSTGTSSGSTSASSIRSTPSSRISRFSSASTGSRTESRPSCASCRRRSGAPFRAQRRSRPRAPRSALAPGCVALRQCPASGTSSKAPITCSSCSASWSRSGACARSSSW